MGKLYAVKVGKKSGIYTTWAEAEAQVKGYPGAKYKSFSNEKEALEYLNGDETIRDKTVSDAITKVVDEAIVLRPFTPDESQEYFEVHSDGGARGGNPGFGGYGYVVVDKNHKIVEEGYGYGQNMTNNQAELRGAIEGIKTVKKGAKVYFITDSTYVYAGFANDFPDQPRFEKWEKKNWKDVKNLELVKELYELGKEHELECIPRKYEKGKTNYLPFAHGDKKHEDGRYENPYNKICDRLANIGIVDALNNESDKESPIRLITGGEKVMEKRDVEYKDGEVVTYDQKAPFYVAELNEMRHGKVVDADGNEAKVN